jgi:hypothetical protein
MAILMAAAVFAAAQDAKPDQIVVPLSNPAKPAIVNVHVIMGGIKITGYEGKDIQIEAKAREKQIGEEREEKEGDLRIPRPARPTAPKIAWLGPDKDKDKEKDKKDKTTGMKQIPIDNSGLSVEEDNNKVDIQVESFRKTVDLNIKVPFASSLKLNSNNNGDIWVGGVNGEIEVECLNGDVTLKDVSGTVVVSALNGDVTVTMAKVTPDKPMSFNTLNGDIDVTFPADIKANLKIKSDMGEVFSDFDITLKQAPQKVEQNKTKEGGKFRISFDRTVLGAINGGGPEFQFMNMNGDIYIRKGK